MSELLSTTVSFETDAQGKPINVEPGSALLTVRAPGECLVEQADPGVNLGSSNCPLRCGSCGTLGSVRGGIYYSAIPEGDLSAPFCGRYQGRQPAIAESSPQTVPEQPRTEVSLEHLGVLAQAVGLCVEYVPRDRFPETLNQAA